MGMEISIETSFWVHRDKKFIQMETGIFWVSTDIHLVFLIVIVFNAPMGTAVLGRPCTD
jgi:hypothetical protein